MTSPIDYQSTRARPGSSRFATIVVLLLVGLGVLFFRPLLGLLMSFALQGSSKSVAPADATRSVAVSLMRWGVLGSVPDRNPDYTNLKNSIATQMTGINGFTESDGFHGDGTDWYEVELLPDLAAELKSNLDQSPLIKRSEKFPRENSAPSWWPKTWPADAKCYAKDLEYFVVTRGGTRAWFLRIRT